MRHRGGDVDAREGSAFRERIVADRCDRFGNAERSEHETSAEGVVTNRGDRCGNDGVHATGQQCARCCLNDGVATVTRVIAGISAGHAHAVNCRAMLECKCANRPYRGRDFHTVECFAVKECRSADAVETHGEGDATQFGTSPEGIVAHRVHTDGDIDAGER